MSSSLIFQHMCVCNRSLAASSDASLYFITINYSFVMTPWNWWQKSYIVGVPGNSTLVHIGLAVWFSLCSVHFSCLFSL